MAMPVPVSDRLLRTDFSALLGIGDDDRIPPSGRVTFQVEGRQLQADKFLLATRSEYFESMLRKGLSEGSASVVEIPSTTYAAFEAVLRFLYSAGKAGDALFREADPLEVLHLSVEFLLDDLSRLCEWKMVQDLTTEGALSVFGSIASIRSKVPALAEACVDRLR